MSDLIYKKLFERDWLPAVDLDKLRDVDRILTVVNASLLTAQNNIRTLREMDFFSDEEGDIATLGLFYNLARHMKTVAQLHKRVESTKELLDMAKEEEE